jgi:hypothetical protein
MTLPWANLHWGIKIDNDPVLSGFFHHYKAHTRGIFLGNLDPGVQPFFFKKGHRGISQLVFADTVTKNVTIQPDW